MSSLENKGETVWEQVGRTRYQNLGSNKKKPQWISQLLITEMWKLAVLS